MANFGLFAGGLGESLQQGWQNQQIADFRQQELKLQAQAQQNAEQRFNITRIDAVRTDAIKGIADAVAQMKVAGIDNAKISQQLMPWVEQTAKLTKSSGLDPSTVYAQFAGALAMPAATKTEEAMTAAKEKPEVKVLTTPAGDQEIRIVNPRKGTVTTPEGGSTQQPLEGMAPGLGAPSPLAPAAPKPMGQQPGTPGTAAPPVGLMKTSFNERFAGEPTAAAPGVLPTAKPAAANPEGSNLLNQLATHSGMTPEQLDMTARQLNDGNVSVLTNLGRGRQGGAAVKATRAWAAHILMSEQGMSATEAAKTANMNAAEFMGIKRGASALGQREAQVIGAITTAQQTAPRVLEASAKVDRTQYPTLNKVLLAWREGTGDENVIRLGIAINTFVNNYARALGAGSSVLTDTARKEAMANLERSWSQGQIGAAIDQMLNKELPSELRGAKGATKEFLGGRGTEEPAKKRYKFNPDTGELE